MVVLPRYHDLNKAAHDSKQFDTRYPMAQHGRSRLKFKNLYVHRRRDHLHVARVKRNKRQNKPNVHQFTINGVHITFTSYGTFSSSKLILLQLAAALSISHGDVDAFVK
jgi:hypothetical protein